VGPNDRERSMADVTSIFARTSELRVVIWRDLFVIVDNGHARPSDYMSCAREVNQLAQRYPDGVGLITVLPPLTTPPEPEVRQAIKDAYGVVAKHLRAVCWIVEGTEFRAAAVRAALAGLRLLMRPPFPTMVTSTYQEGVTWVLAKLHTRPGQDTDPRFAIAGIKRDLASVPPSSGYAAQAPGDWQ
jgi:hypothetical protein